MKKFLLWVSIFVGSSCLIFFGIKIYSRVRNLGSNITLTTFEMIGVLRTSGVTSEIADKWNLYVPVVIPTYQIRELKQEKINFNGIDFYGAFLEDYAGTEKRYQLNIGRYIGKCVEVKAVMHLVTKSFVNETYTVNGEYTYRNLYLSPISIKQLDYNKCDPYPSSFISDLEKTGAKIQIFSGTLQRQDRPAPDIGYDYSLSLETPFVDELSASGLPREASSITVEPSNNEIWKFVEQNIGRNVSLEGYMTWGYSESRYLLITSARK